MSDNMFITLHAKEYPKMEYLVNCDNVLAFRSLDELNPERGTLTIGPEGTIHVKESLDEIKCLLNYYPTCT